MATRFEWDPVKAAANLRKHGVSFEIAMRAFADPFALTEQDRIEGGEAIEVIRIISARAADRTETRRHEQETR